MMMAQKKFAPKLVAKTMILAFVALLFLFPLLWMISSSLKGTRDVFSSPFRWIVPPLRWSNYRMVWNSEELPLPHVFLNSIIVAVVASTVKLFFASLAAYAFARIEFCGKRIFFILILSSLMIPTQVTIIPRFMMFKTMGLYNTLWALILPELFGATAIFFLRQAYLALPRDLVDAAKVDGAGHWTIWLRIMLPLTVPSLVSMGILSFIGSWNDYLSPLIFLVKPKKYVISQAIRWWMLDEAQRYELTMATATSAIIPILIIFLFSQRYFVEGIARSGIKE
jgi:multiple sugar transport system permease protein